MFRSALPRTLDALDYQSDVCCAYLILELVRHLECRAILRSSLPVIVNSRRLDVGVPKPLLHLGDVGLVIERIGRCRRPQRMRTDLEPQRA